MALGNALPKAISLAKEFITAAIRRSADISIGQGSGPLQV
jgi:hydroxymethylpyrimidine/phosphomethylpyrimidine kinase